jgi:YD repeat-containing protein
MADAHILNAVFQEIKQKNSHLTRRDTEYIIEGNKTLVGKISTNTGQNQSMEDRIIFEMYNDDGKPVCSSYKNGPKISYLWGDFNSQYNIAKVENATYGDAAYTSFEDEGGSNWTYSSTSGTVGSMYSYTGTKSFTLASGYITKTGLNLGKQYVVSYRSRSGQVNISNTIGSTITGITASNGWTYYEHRFTLNGTSLAISGNGKIIDELRLYPAHAMMTTYTHELLVGIRSETDPSGRTVFYEYDEFGRLIQVKDEDGDILKEHRYNYAK